MPDPIQTPPQKHDKSGPTRTVLVVDDSKSIRTLFRIYLRKLPVQIEFAEDGVEALERIQARVPDLIILDLMMPRMDGLTLLEHLNGSDSTRNVPRIIVTSRQDVASLDSILRTGVTTYMLKPINIDRLLPMILSGLEHGCFAGAAKPTPA